MFSSGEESATNAIANYNPVQTSTEELNGNDKDLSVKSHMSDNNMNIDAVSYKSQVSGPVESVRTHENCRCSSSIFSGNNDMVEFYLPLTGTFCGCGQRPPGLRRPEEPTSLVNILRSWQVEFLGSYGIFLGDQLVKAHHRSAKDLAKALYRYRKKNNMKLFDVKTCSSALKVRSFVYSTFVILS
jgi:hypothetical protein